VNKIRVLCTLRFSAGQLDKLRAISPRLKVEQRTTQRVDEIRDLLPEVEVLYTFDCLPAPEEAPQLKWIQLHSAGADHVRDTPIWRSNVLLTTTSGIHTTPMAEYVFAMMLAFARRLPRMLYYQGRNEWPRRRWDLFVPQELRGATVGIIGYGSIGREVGRLAKAFGMHVLAVKQSAERMTDTGYTERGTGDIEGILPDATYAPEQLGEMLEKCDYVVIAVPLTAETTHLIGAPELKAMKKSAYLINVARGPVVDEKALVEALSKEEIAGAGLDVFEVEPLPPDSPLWGMPNVIISPHVAGYTPHYDDRATDLFAENLRRYLAAEGPLLNLVDRGKGY
jgi:phosphoglycerate dehydrogenase-like enzyme